MKFLPRLVLLTAVLQSLSCGAPRALAQDEPGYISQIAQLNLEELLDQDVTSVLRKEQPISHAPAAVYVLTAEDIRRAGATSIPEALRLVPGMNVLRVNSNQWLVSARGLDPKGATKLLVLIDGRVVYSPFIEGVFWDIQDVVLEDIERIEVIRGPGAVTWGENAVNGVINIITKNAFETQGLLAVAGGGKEERGFGTVRYGGKVGSSTSYRAYGKYLNRDQFLLEDDQGADDQWEMHRGGFRVDSELSTASTFTFQGDIYNGESHDLEPQLVSLIPPSRPVVENETRSEGGNLLARYVRDLSSTSQISAQTYWDRTSRRDQVSAEKRDTWELDIQHHVKVSESHDVVYGGEYRVGRDDMGESLSAQWHPPERTDHLVTVFGQDEIAIVPQTFSVIPGTKLGYNDYSGFEYQPALKSVWSVTDNSTAWASISRAVRIPSRFDEDLEFIAGASETPDGQTVTPTIFGNRGFDSEKLMAYELGFRSEPVKRFSYDLAAFYQHYDDLFSLEPGQPFVVADPGASRIVVPLTVGNGLNGDTYGVELATTWKPSEITTFTATYSYVEVDYAHDPGSQDFIAIAAERRTPHNQATLRGHFNLLWQLEFDTLLYYVDSIPVFNVQSYLRTDMRLAWNATENWSIELVGQNLFDPKHAEAGATPIVEIQRALFGRVTYKMR